MRTSPLEEATTERDEPLPPDDAWPDLDLRLGYDAAPLIPPGLYTARAMRAKIRSSWGGAQRLYLDFEIRGGNCDGKVVSFICTLPARRDGRWAKGVAPASRFFRAWAVANGGPPRRRDRMGLDVFKNRLFEVEVRTVDRDARRSREHPDGRPLPEAVQYSVVDRVLERIA